MTFTVELKHMPSSPSASSSSGPAAGTTAGAKLQPKEHGAYAILGIPMVTALLITGPTIVGVCVAVAAIAGFLAHEPLLVTWGHRGARAQRTTPTAARSLTWLLLLTLVCGSLAWLIGTSSVRLSLLACAALAASSFVVAIAGQHRSLLGQLWGVVGLSIPCLPILLAGGMADPVALQLWGIWLIGFTGTTMAVRSVIAYQKRQSRRIAVVVIAVLSAMVAAIMWTGETWAASVLPMLLMSWFLLAWPPPAKQLRRVGWTLVVGTVATALWMIISVV